MFALCVCVCVGAPPLPPARLSPAVSLLSGIGTLINFISVCGGEQLLPVWAGEDGEEALASLSLEKEPKSVQELLELDGDPATAER